jgi:hypothetical protein
MVLANATQSASIFFSRAVSSSAQAVPHNPANTSAKHTQDVICWTSTQTPSLAALTCARAGAALTQHIRLQRRKIHIFSRKSRLSPKNRSMGEDKSRELARRKFAAPDTISYEADARPTHLQGPVIAMTVARQRATVPGTPANPIIP